MKIELAKHCDEALLADINSLIPQLSNSARVLTLADLKTIVDSDATHLLTAVNEGQMYGILTLVIFRIPTGLRAWVEDVVVCKSARGQGVGKLLLQTAVQLAKEKGAKTIDLTSRSAREAANRLYHQVGFEKRDTNVYRIRL